MTASTLYITSSPNFILVYLQGSPAISTIAMLSLLCGSPDVVDSAFYDTGRSRRASLPKLGRSSGSTKKKRVLKGSIGAPTGFRHEGHVGTDNMMAPTGAWDLDQWRAELEKHMQPGAQSTSTTPGVSRNNSVLSPRRKPVPSLLPLPRESSPPLSSAGSSPTRTTPIREDSAL